MDRHHYETFEKFGNNTFLIHLDNGRAWVLLMCWHVCVYVKILFFSSCLTCNCAVARPTLGLFSLQIWALLQRWAFYPSSSRAVLQVQTRMWSNVVRMFSNCLCVRCSYLLSWSPHPVLLSSQHFSLSFRSFFRIRRSTWLRLRLLSLPQYRLSDVMRASLSHDPLHSVAPLLSERHLTALDRRLKTVLETVSRCQKTHSEGGGDDEVFYDDTAQLKDMFTSAG